MSQKMRKEDVDLYYRVYAQLEAFHSEIGLLAKRSPKDVVNDFKLKYINKALEEANTLLESSRPFSDFTVFDRDNLPSNSDVTMILAQYLGAMEDFRSSKIERRAGIWYWVAEGKQGDITTTPPKRLQGA